LWQHFCRFQVVRRKTQRIEVGLSGQRIQNFGGRDKFEKMTPGSRKVSRRAKLIEVIFVVTG